MKRITIIGGGASGTLLAANLLRSETDAEFEVCLVESRSRLGRGVAFGTIYDSHLLNVPAGRMGAFPDQVDHFHKWLLEKGETFGADDFVPRRLYGEYLRSVFAESIENAAPNIKHELIDDEAVDMFVDDDHADVILGSGRVLRSERVALAFGNFAPPQPSVSDLSFASAEKYFRDAWNSRLYETIEPDDSIFIVGTGLSMVDVALHFNKHGHRGKIYAISTRGMLPARHELGYSYPSFYEELKPMTRITEILKAVRRHIDIAESSDSNWRAVIDSLRPVTQQIWLDLPIAEKRYFMQHLSRYWNVARHRMPSEVGTILDEMQASGKLEILKGRLKDISYDNDTFTITSSCNGEVHTARSNALVNCIGSESNFSKIDSKFVQNLISRGHIRNDDLAMGIAATPNGEVIGKTDRPSGVVFTLGTALKGTLWETTAIPEIRVQARDLATRFLRGL